MVAIVLVEPFDPVNVSAAARAMASFGAGPLILIDPVFDTDLLDPAIARGGTPILEAHETVHDLKQLKDRFDLLIGTSGKPSNGTHERTYLTSFELRERAIENAAIVFGRESDGLRLEELEACDLIVSIETLETQRALNLSHAVAVILAIMTRIDEPVQRRHPASRREDRDALIEAVARLYERVAHATGTQRFEGLETQQRVWKRVLARTDASEQEIRTLFGLITLFERSLED